MALKVVNVTVVGANGMMGRNVAAIFASFGNAKVFMVGRERRQVEKAAEKAFRSVRAEGIKNNLTPCDYTSLEECIEKSDIVFESVAENWDVKLWVTKKIAEAASRNIELCKNTVFCTGTSGLSITKLAEVFPDDLRRHYMGMHFFNPPYTMTLCEMTPTCYTERNFFDEVVDFCKSRLYRTIVEVKDSPAFLGNRIGFQFINEALQYAEKYKYNGGIDYIDAIFGGFTGRAMAPMVTANFVGLDVHKAIVENIYENTEDFAHDTFIMPQFAKKLIAEGHIGRKAEGGLYRTVYHESGIKIRQVYDIESGTYRNIMEYRFPFAESMINDLYVGNYESAFHTLVNNRSVEAEICCRFLLKYILYALRTTEIVGYDIHAADDVMAAGFNWCPPLAMIEVFGGCKELKTLCKERLGKNVLDKVDLEKLLERVTPSKYDYRKFIKSKR